jgi:hypothetical protein
VVTIEAQSILMTFSCFSIDDRCVRSTAHGTCFPAELPDSCFSLSKRGSGLDIGSVTLVKVKTATCYTPAS